MLDALGLSEDAQVAYQSLLTHPPLTREEISAVLFNWSAPRLTGTLDELRENGFLAIRTGPAARYAMVAPDVAITALLQRREDEHRKLREAIPDLMKQYASAYQAPPSDFVEVLPADGSLPVTRINQLMASVTRSVRALDRPPYPPVVAAEYNEPEFDMLARGVEVRVVYDQDVVADPDRWPDMQAGMAAGEQARTIAGLPWRLTLFDDEFATMPVLSATGEYVTTLVVHGPPLMVVLGAYFEEIWRRALPLTWTDHPRGAPAALSRADQLLSLLTAGVSDDAIGRSLGISPSTVQRGVRALLTRLGARTRFQAGVAVGRQERPAPPPEE